MAEATQRMDRLVLLVLVYVTFGLITIRTRGIRGLGWALLHALLLLILGSVLSLATYVLCHGWPLL